MVSLKLSQIEEQSVPYIQSYMKLDMKDKNGESPVCHLTEKQHRRHGLKLRRKHIRRSCKNETLNCGDKL